MKYPPTIARDIGDCVGSILGWEAPWRKEMPTHSRILTLENHMDREAYQATVHGVPESDTTKHTCTQAHAKDNMQHIADTGKDYNLQPMKHKPSDTAALSWGSMANNTDCEFAYQITPIA